MTNLLDLVRIAKSSTLSSLILKGFSVDQVIEYALNFEKFNGKVILIPEKQAEEELRLSESLGICLISIEDNIYPDDLRRIHNPPLILYAKGNLDLLSKVKFAIIGARAATIESRALAQNFAKDLAHFGFTIVSGFAFGVDTASCLGSLDFGTIQILGSGVNIVYPRENINLYKSVLDNNELFLSELPPNFPVKPENFPLRNRIISGMSKGILLVQASKKNGSSGSLITARIALSQEKDLFAIPGHPLDAKFEGGNNLIKEGNAIFTTIPSDIIDMIGYHINKKPKLYTFTKNSDSSVKAKNFTPNLEINRSVYEKIKLILGTNPVSLNDIAEAVLCSVQEVQVAVTELELLEEVRKHKDGRFSASFL